MGTLVMVLVFLYGCSSGTSYFERSYTISEKFESFQLMPKYQYFYVGLADSPDALVGVRNGYALKSPHWHEVDMDEKKMRHMVDEMLNNPGAEYNIEPNGAYIFNGRGETIGVWYSVWALPLLTFMTDTDFSISYPMAVFPPSNRDPEERGFGPSFRRF